MSAWLRVEFHCHTVFSKDSLTSPQALLEACRRKGIDRVIVTDHNSIEGALACKALDSQSVIVGEEVMTSQGELLAAFVQQAIPAGLAPKTAIARLREQDAFISVSHPFDIWRAGRWELADLIEITPLVDAIEVFNARCILPRFNRQAQKFAQAHGLPGTVGSDAHTTFELGKATQRLAPFENAAGLKRSLQQATASVSLSSPLVHLSSRYASWRKRRSRNELAGAAR
jgi:hypothetical protein